MTDDELAELVARCGNIYTRFGLSPPMALRDAAKRWAGLSQEDVARVVEVHLRSHRRLYVSGFSDAYFGMVQSAIRKAIELKHPARDHVDDEPERPRRQASVVVFARSTRPAAMRMRLTTARTPTRSARMRRSMHDGESRTVFPFGAARVDSGDDCLRYGVRCAIGVRRAHGIKFSTRTDERVL